MTKQDLHKQLERAYEALNNLKDREARAMHTPETGFDSKSERILQQHIRYLRQLIQEAS